MAVIESSETGAVQHQARCSTEVDAHVGMVLRMRRMELGLSQEKVAAQLGITAQQLKKYERGENRIGASRLHQIAGILNVAVQYFFQDIPSSLSEAGGESTNSVHSSSLARALEDGPTVRLLHMFSSVRDKQLKNKVLSIVEAIIVRS